MKKLMLLILALPVLLSGQTDSNIVKKIDSLRTALAADSSYIYRFRKIRPYLNYHERHSLFTEFETNFYGPQLGVVLYEKHIVCAGIYFSGVQTRKPVQMLDNNKMVSRKVDVNFYSLYYQYILFDKRFFQLQLPFELSRGNYSASFSDSSQQVYKTIDDPLWLVGTGLLGVVKPLRWIGLSGMIGYRYTSEALFDGFYYTIGVWLNIRQVMSDGRYHLVKKKKYARDIQAMTKI